MACVLVAFLAGTACAQDTGALEYKVKAGFLFNFAKFVEWPSESMPDGKSPIVIGIVGTDPFGKILDDALNGQRIDDRPFIVRRLTRPGDLSEWTACHLVFIARSEQGNVAEILRRVGELPILTISEHPQFVEQGGIIRFLYEQKRISFEVNLDAARLARLKINSNLLKVAHHVHTRGVATEMK